MGGTWRGSMLAALVATLGRPEWWSMALAAFLVRGGIVLVLLPVVVLPTPAALANEFAPTIEAFAFGGVNAERLLLVICLGATLLVAIGASGLAGAWLDQALLREAATDDDLDLGWEPAHPSTRAALTLRLAAHLPTIAILVYAAIRLVGAAYDELLSPGATTTPIFLRVAARAPDALALVLGVWLAGEAIGAQAGRRAAAGAGARDSLWRSIRQLLTFRGLGTLVLTTAVVCVALVPFLFAAARAMDHLRDVLTDAPDVVQVGAALLVFVASWILGLAVLGAALAWRSAAWTAEVAPALRPVPAPSPAATAEATTG